MVQFGQARKFYKPVFTVETKGVMAGSKISSSSRKRASLPRILLVQMDGASPDALCSAFQRNGFEVVTTTTVKQALVLATEKFAALVCDLRIPAPGDGFTLVNAMRHFHPEAVTMVMSDYPALRESLSSLLPQADEILISPLPAAEVVALLKSRMGKPKNPFLNVFEPIATVLERHAGKTISEWLVRVNANKELMGIPLSDEQRTGHLPRLLRELVQRLRTPHLEEGTAQVSMAARAHGKARSQQGYDAAMLIEESRMLQVCIFKTLRTNLSALDLSLVLTDVMTIADEVDSQLKQTMASFTENSLRHGHNGCAPHRETKRLPNKAEQELKICRS